MHRLHRNFTANTVRMSRCAPIATVIGVAGHSTFGLNRRCHRLLCRWFLILLSACLVTVLFAHEIPD
jgi:hypothetical protein